MATQAEKEDTSSKIGDQLKIAEDAMDVLVPLFARANQQGMIGKPERDEFAHIARGFKNNIMAWHSRLTGISVREGTDGVHVLGGPGR